MIIDWSGDEKLLNTLQRLSQPRFEGLVKLTMRDMFNRAAATYPSPGGTPLDTGELRKSRRVNGDTFGYMVDYAPHVEYGHRTTGGGYVPGKHFLKDNVDIQKKKLRKDCIEQLQKLAGG